MKKYALISVSDKSGIVPFAKKLEALGYTIISSGGTARVLKKQSVQVVPVEQITGNPECFDGRMKTISFQVESGILYDRTNMRHVREACELKIPRIDVVVCNLYPFESTVSVTTQEKEAIELIDVGGPTMLRAAAKNFRHVYAVFDPEDYSKVLDDIRLGKRESSLRRRLSAKVFSYLSWYDAHIAHYLSEEEFPDVYPLVGKKITDLRYGDNAHQNAAWYQVPMKKSPMNNLQKLSGRDLSMTNLTDIHAGVESVRLFSEPAAVVIKHNTPCGIAMGKTPKESLARAIEADPVSAFGGVIVMNKPMDSAGAALLEDFKKNKKSHMDIIAAPIFTKSALQHLTQIRKTTGLYAFSNIDSTSEDRHQIKWVDGGFAIQTLSNSKDSDDLLWNVVTAKKPTPKQMKQMLVAWKFIARIKSNAIIVVDGRIPMTRGIGTGQTSRIGAAKIALEQAGAYTKGAILASDGFLPFPDTVKLAASYGVSCIIQPGGSIQDEASIREAEKAGMVMIATGRRVFWH